jgi:hypothetical protein
MRLRTILISSSTVLFGLLLPGMAQAAGCENELARAQNSSLALPDCRVYEMVSPLNKNGGDISSIDAVNGAGVVQATPKGEGITYVSLTAFGIESKGKLIQPEGAPVGNQYLSTRQEGGWSTRNISKPTTAPEVTSNEGTPYVAFNASLTEGLNRGRVESLVSNASSESIGNSPYAYGDFATPDLKHIVTSTAPFRGGELDEFSNGQIAPVDVSPTSGEVLPGATLGSEAGRQDRVISDDGSRVFWSEKGNESGASNLYVREGLGTVAPRTVQVDAGIGGKGLFLTASTDGSKVFFTPQRGGDLYEYDLESKSTTDLAPGLGVIGVLGASEDGSYVYFVSGDLELYVWHAGVGATFIAGLSGGDRVVENGIGIVAPWSAELSGRTARVTPDGRSVVFTSKANITSYDNVGPHCIPIGIEENNITGYSAGACEEVYIYEVGSTGPVCVSCGPNGAQPIGPSFIPGGAKYDQNGAIYAPRVLAAEGNRVFFDSNDTLVSADTNHQEDVYEWERVGTGSCQASEAHEGGCVSLISGGVSSEGSQFLDASENGDNVFFLTRQQLVPGDTDQEVDVYDAREGGGIAQATAPACTGTGCQGVPAATPIFATPASVTAEGVGNFTGPSEAPAVKPKGLTNAQKLTNALKACKKQPKRKQAKCESAARKKYAPAKRAKGKKSSRRSG